MGTLARLHSASDAILLITSATIWRLHLFHKVLLRSKRGEVRDTYATRDVAPHFNVAGMPWGSFYGKVTLGHCISTISKVL